MKPRAAVYTPGSFMDAPGVTPFIDISWAIYGGASASRHENVRIPDATLVKGEKVRVQPATCAQQTLPRALQP